MLIGEIIPHLYQYLRDNPAASERTAYDFILVDEYQDLNKAEQAVIDLLGEQAQLCIVGDDDQSIYSFKFAHPTGIRSFPDVHANTADHEILECRRCPSLVVEMANALISRNQNREPRQLTPFAANGSGDVRILQYQGLTLEATGIAKFVQDQIQQHGRSPQDILILAQRRTIGNPIHDALVRLGIPSKCYYHESELESLDAQEKMALLKLLVDPDDRIALRWLLGWGSNDFRSGAYGRVRRHCETSGLTPWQTMEQLEQGALKISYSNALIERYREICAAIDALRGDDEMIAFVDHWLPASEPGLLPLRELALELAPAADGPGGLLTALIETISTPEIPPDVTDVRIMSLHKSKGLSSPVVVIAGCVEGLLPAPADKDLTPEEEQEHLEEQRRLFYVGLTRVKAKPEDGQPGTLVLTYSRSMSLASAMQSGISPASVSYGDARLLASRFIRELGPSAPAPRAG